MPETQPTTLSFYDFKRRVDGASADAPALAQPPPWEQVRSDIGSCFPTKDAYQAIVALRAVETDIAIRRLCDGAQLSSYAHIASTIRQALQRGTPTQADAVDWDRAFALAATQPDGLGLSNDHMTRTEPRWSTLANAVSGLRALGYSVNLPEEGGVDIPDAERARLHDEILAFAKRHGPAVATIAARLMGNHYSAVTGRFNVGRSGSTVEVDAKPGWPLSYIYHLGLRFFDQPASPPGTEAELQRFIDLVSNAAALEDVLVPFLALQFAWVQDLPAMTMKSALFDASYTPAQAKPAHALQYLGWLMDQPLLRNLKDAATGYTGAQVGAVARALLGLAEKGAPTAFSVIDPNLAVIGTRLDRSRAEKLLRTVFAFDKGANQELAFPPKDNHIDGAFRPLLKAGSNLVMQPPPLASRAIVNATLAWCREQWPTKGFDDEALGPLFEEFVRASLAAKGMAVLHGKYGGKQDAGQCDAVVETNDAIIFVELKSKMLRREGRGGDGVTLLADLGQAAVRPLSQAMKHHAYLKVHGNEMTLRRDGTEQNLALRGREVLKVSVSRGDMSSLHERPYLQVLLRSGSYGRFDAEELGRQSEFDQLHRYFKRLMNAALEVGDLDAKNPMPFSTCWSLSVFQLLVLLERATDAESFSHELQRTRRVIMPNRDFYVGYEFMLGLKERAEAQAREDG
jgi:Holliday junction resolvase-like predicted endonuclease